MQSPEKLFGDAGLIEHVQVAFRGCPWCISEWGERGDHSDGGFKILAGFETLGRMPAWSRFADITNSCSRDLLIPAISFSNCLRHSSELSVAILASRLSVDSKWREGRSV